MTSPSADDLTRARMLLERALSGTVTIGSLPPGLPLDVPVPPGGQVLGTIVRSSGPPDQTPPASGDSVSIYLDAPGELSELLAFYEQSFTAQGWSASDHGPR